MWSSLAARLDNMYDGVCFLFMFPASVGSSSVVFGQGG